MDSARKAQSLSTQQVGSLRFSKVFSLYRHVLVSVGWWQRVMAFGTQRATDQTMFEDNKSSSSALQRNINESESLKNRSEQQVGKTRLSCSTPHMSTLTRPFSLARRVFLLQANEFSPFVAVCFLFAVYSALNIFTGTIIELSKVVYISRFSPTSRSLPPSLSFPLSLPCPFPFCLLPASSFSSASPPISLYR